MSPCKAEMPYFDEAMKKYKHEKCRNFNVNLTMEAEEKLKRQQKAFYKYEEGYDMNIVYYIDSDAAMTYYLNAVPRIFIYRH